MGPLRVRTCRPRGPVSIGPLAAAIDPYPIDGYELAVREQHEREFNWKVLVENY